MNAPRMSLGGVKMMKPQRASMAGGGPARRQTMATSGPSQAGGPARRQTMATTERRLSSGRSITSTRSSKDPRGDVKDPRYMKECRMRVKDFLLERGVDVTQKMLSSPSQQVSIFFFFVFLLFPFSSLPFHMLIPLPGLLQHVPLSLEGD